MATPHLPTSPSSCGSSDREPTASANRTRSTGRRRRRDDSLKRRLVSSAVPKPANIRIVHNFERYIDTYGPRVYGYWPGNSPSSGPYTGSRGQDLNRRDSASRNDSLRRNARSHSTVGPSCCPSSLCCLIYLGARHSRSPIELRGRAGARHRSRRPCRRRWMGRGDKNGADGPPSTPCVSRSDTCRWTASSSSARARKTKRRCSTTASTSATAAPSRHRRRPGRGHDAHLSRPRQLRNPCLRTSARLAVFSGKMPPWSVQKPRRSDSAITAASSAEPTPRPRASSAT